MSADLHLHVIDKKNLLYAKNYGRANITKPVNGKWVSGYDKYLINGVWKEFYQISNKEMKLFDGKILPKHKFCVLKTNDDLVTQTPNVWIGSVSWLKAELLGDNDTFIPKTVEKINNIAYKYPVIDDKLISKIKKCFDLPNNTKKKGGVWDGDGYKIAKVDDVVDFLNKHKGKYIYPISW